MALTAQVLPSINPTGVSAAATKPITDGREVTVVAEQESGFNIWGALDDLGTTVVNGIASIAETAAGVKVNQLVGGAETSLTDAGTPGNNPGDLPQGGGMGGYGVPLLIGGALLAAFVVYKALD